MSSTIMHAYEPGFATPPGEILEENRLQHEHMLPWTHLNGLKVKLRFTGDGLKYRDQIRDFASRNRS